MTPRSIAPARTSGGPAPSTSTPPAAPTGPPPSAPTTGSSSAPCSTSRRSPAGSCRSPAGSTSASRSCRPGPGGTAAFRTKCELAVELLREQARIAPGKHLGVFDGGYALGSVVRPLVLPEDGSPRIDFLTRLAARRPALTALPPEERPEGKTGPKPKWGRRLPPPRQGGRWRRGGRSGPPSSTAGSGRSAGRRWCACGGCWDDVPVKAVVAEVEGYKKRFTLVTSAVELTGLQMVELFAARFRQEDGFRDLKQRLGWEECRAWTGTRSSGPARRSG